MLDSISRPESNMFIGCCYTDYDTYGYYRYKILYINDDIVTYVIIRNLRNCVSDMSVCSMPRYYFENFELVTDNDFPISNEVI